MWLGIIGNKDDGWCIVDLWVVEFYYGLFEFSFCFGGIYDDKVLWL